GLVADRTGQPTQLAARRRQGGIEPLLDDRDRVAVEGLTQGETDGGDLLGSQRSVRPGRVEDGEHRAQAPVGEQPIDGRHPRTVSNPWPCPSTETASPWKTVRSSPPRPPGLCCAPAGRNLPPLRGGRS